MQIKVQHLQIIKNIIGPYKIEVYLYDSRAKNNAKPFSDVDLVIKSDLSRRDFINLKNQFEDSNLPYKVDLILWDDLTEDFKNRIGPDLIKI